jgi:hypothetical protein
MQGGNLDDLLEAYLAPQPNRVLRHPVVAMLIPIIGLAPRFYRWLYVRRVDQLHRALGNLERDLAQGVDTCRFAGYQTRIDEIESSVRLLKIARPFEVDLQRLRAHLRLVQGRRMGAVE